MKMGILNADDILVKFIDIVDDLELYITESLERIEETTKKYSYRWDYYFDSLDFQRDLIEQVQKALTDNDRNETIRLSIIAMSLSKLIKDDIDCIIDEHVNGNDEDWDEFH